MSDDLDDLDLHAWQPPALPHNLVDSVLARVTATDEAIAAAVHKRRRGYAIAAAACAGSVAAGLALWLALRPGPAPQIDVAMALSPRTIHLGETSVELARGSFLRTTRVGDHLSAVQSGTATWHVAPHDQLEIGAGSSASIKATGASLRVESQMTNTSIAMVIGGIALSTATVALVTATVYEGHVETSSAGVTKTIPGGLTVQLGDAVVPIVAGPARMPLVPTGGDLAISPGESAVIYASDSHALVEIKQEHCKLHVVVDDADIDTPRNVAREDNGIVLLDLTADSYRYLARCEDQNTPTMSGTIEVRHDDCREKYCGDNRLINLMTPKLGEQFGDTVTVSGTRAEDVTLWIGNTQIPDAKNSADDGTSHRFLATLDHKPNQSVVVRVERGAITEFYVQHSAPAGAATIARPSVPPKAGSANTPPCDAKAEIEAGTKATENGDNVAALAHFEAAYACLPRSGHPKDLAFMAACNGANLPAARRWWRKLSNDQQNRYVSLCLHSKISRDQLDAP